MGEGQPHRDRTLAQAAATALHQMILSGEIEHGSPLRLQELAGRLDMSVMPVREAIRQLSALGLVEVIPHKGAWVRRLSVEDFVDTHQTRLMLELPAVERAARHFTDQDREIAEDLLRQHVELSRLGDSQGMRAAHREFHFALIRPCGSVWLPRALEPVWQNSERYRFASPPDEPEIRAVDAEHRTILEACAGHRPSVAVSALEAHLQRAFERMLYRLKARVDREAGDPVPADERQG